MKSFVTPTISPTVDRFVANANTPQGASKRMRRN